MYLKSNQMAEKELNKTTMMQTAALFERFNENRRERFTLVNGEIAPTKYTNNAFEFIVVVHRSSGVAQIERF